MTSHLSIGRQLRNGSKQPSRLILSINRLKRTAKREVFRISDVPGPGSYNEKPLDLSHKASLGGRTRLPSDMRTVPGPGAYNVKQPPKANPVSRR